MVASVQEFFWTRTFDIMSHNTKTFGCFFLSRYVDNRFAIMEPGLRSHPAWDRFFFLDFYGAPVTLETLDDHMMLGQVVDLEQLTCVTTFDFHKLAIRSSSSAGSNQLLLSGFKSRLYNIFRHTYPAAYTQAVVTKLCKAYVLKGFHHHELSSIVARVGHAENSCLNSYVVFMVSD